MLESWFHRLLQPKARGFKDRAKGVARRHRFTRPLFESLEDRLTPTTYSVNSLLDASVGVGDSGTLRYCINLANTNHTGTAAAPDLIQITTGSGTISVGSSTAGLSLPALASNEVAIIDATTANGYFDVPLIILNGTSATAGPSANGLTISGGSSTVKGFDIINFSGNGIQLDTNGGDTVQSCYIGITAANVVAANAGDGILVNKTPGNTIGGSATGQGNVISGNAGDGIAITGAGATGNVVISNFIGTNTAGTSALGNTGNGVSITNGARANTVGNNNPVSSITYYNTDSVSKPVSLWQGIRASDTANQYLISGTSDTNGLLFSGTIAGAGTSYLVNYPNAATTSVYGPDNQGNGVVGLVGVYKNADFATAPVTINGFLFVGTTNQLSNSSLYTTIDYPGAKYNYVHSTMEGLVVGNYDSPAAHGQDGLPLGPGHAFLYSIAKKTFLTDIVFPNSKSNTAYGIWYNGGTSYTICGGYSPDAVNNFDDQNRPIGQGYLVNYDSATGIFSNWASFSYPFGTNSFTHFEGISSVEKGVYTLSADSAQGAWVTVRLNTDGSFGTGAWVNLSDTNFPSTYFTSSNSVYGNQVVGIVFGGGAVTPYQATINTGFQLSNVISGNSGNGIEISAAHNNQVAMNYIGTNVTGTIALGNAQNGIRVTNGAASNLIGGEATGGNNPRATPPVFVTPPQGNLISGNKGDGVLIDAQASQNQLSGNFIGTAASGNSALGNSLDGVAIVDGTGNSLIGCLFQESPFVFYNVVSGNGGNGLRITDSNYTTVQASFFGLGANNLTKVGNALDGLLINGSSANTQFGGVVPLGNVVAASGRNGVEIADTASGVVVFNPFIGLPAFLDNPVGNVLDGILITSTGGNNLIRMTISSNNGANGVHISGNATGVTVVNVVTGLDTNGAVPEPNGANGVLIDGNAHDNTIGGFLIDVAPQNTFSGNGANGLAIVGNAHDNTIFNTFLGTNNDGTNIVGPETFGNAGAGLFIGGTAHDNIVGGTLPMYRNLISANLGGGIQLSDQSYGNQVIGNLIGTDRTGQVPLANHGNGITIVSSNNQIGGSATGDSNTIAFNTQAGVEVNTGTANGILGNSIFKNGQPGILLINNGNKNQTAPVLTAAFQPSPGNVQISGTLVAAANTKYTIQIFTSTSAVPGQAQTLLGSLTVTSDANGVAVFVLSATLPANTGTSFTATATDPANNTSAISAAIGISGNANTLFVASTYGLLLHRVPDANSVYWVNKLNNGATPTSVVLQFEATQEYLQDQVVALYARYLNRAPDTVGEQNWVSFLQAGGTFEQVAEGMVSSQEYFQEQGSTNQGYVIGLYNDVLNRTPAPAEVAGWVALLDSGTSRSTVAIDFLTSSEYYTELVMSDYKTFLGRPADQAGLDSWVNALQTGSTDQEVLARIYGSPEGFAKWS